MSAQENKKQIAVILFNCEKTLEKLDFKLISYENFYQFNKETGLGKIYKQIELKIRICNRLLFN